MLIKNRSLASLYFSLILPLFVFPAYSEIKFESSGVSDPAYTLVPVVGTAEVLLVNIDGEVVHRWGLDAVRARLLPSGNLLVLHGSKWGRGKQPWRDLRNKVIEYDWSGKKVWEFEADDIAHHDVHRYENGNTLVLTRLLLKKEVEKSLKIPLQKEEQFKSERIMEVTPSGEVVWDWKAHEHLDINSDGRRPEIPGEHDKKEPFRDWAHMNTIHPLPKNKWFDAGHEEFRPGNLLIMPRNLWVAYILDRKTKEVVWEYGGDYKGGLSASHEPQMIAPGYPGAGNILIFDNGVRVHDLRTFVLEIDPITKKVVWVYDRGKKFYSRRRGAAHRLKNGNTLISEDEAGDCFEVNPAKETVWLFNPGAEINRCHRYGVDFSPKLEELEQLRLNEKGSKE